MRLQRRELLLSAAFALWGLAVAIALVNVYDRPAPAEQTMGQAKVSNFDAHGPMQWMLALILLPVLAPLVLRPLTRLLVPGGAAG